MIDFSTAKFTLEPVTEHSYNVKVADDVVVIFTNFNDIHYFDDFSFNVVDHYIKEKNNKPTNPARTTVLLDIAYDRFRKQFLKQLESDIRAISALTATERLTSDFFGTHSAFYKGETPKDVFTKLFQQYTSTCAAGDIDPIFYDLMNKKGFLQAEIIEYFNI